MVRSGTEDSRSPPPVSLILDFLQSGLEKGLSTSTLKRQVAALSAALGHKKGKTLAQHPHVRRFLKGASLINPPPEHRFPSWRLNLVLQALCCPPFESLATCTIKVFSLKTLFLVAVTSTRRVSELRALSVNRNLCIFNADSVILRPDPVFIPKVNTHFHRAQDIIIPSFCPDPKTPRERELHYLDVHRALSFYTDRTKDTQKTDSLFPFRSPLWGSPSRHPP